MDKKIVNRSLASEGVQLYKYNDEQKITELGRSSIPEAFSNFSFSSVLPMTLAA